MQEHFQILARYNAWANHRLYTVCERLPGVELILERPAAYFGSILGTLNHILVGDRIWLDRIEHRQAAAPRLDELVYPHFPDLKEARTDEDRRIMGLVDRLRPADYDRTLAYRNTQGEANKTPMTLVLTHLFNHQTHHRGQIHALLKEAGAEPPPLDLVYFLKVA